MPRPADVTAEKIAEWEASYPVEDEDSEMYTPKARAYQREVMYAGDWLLEQLTALGNLSSTTCHKDVEAFGQIAYGREPWDTANLVLAFAKKGEVFEPGPDLAESLVFGGLDSRFGPGAGLTSAEGVRRMMEMMDVKNIGELVARLGCESSAEARAKLQDKLEKMEARYAEVPR